MNTFEQPIPFQPTLYRTAPIPPPRSSSAIRNLASQIASHSPSRPLPEQPTVPVTESQEALHHQSQRPNSFYAEADFEDAPPSARNDAYDNDIDECAEISQEPVNDYANEEQEQYNEQRHEEDGQSYHQHQGESSYNTFQQQSEPEFSAEALIRPVAALMQLDLAGELIYFRDRFADLQQGQPGFEQERSTLLELERSTGALMTSRKVLTEKQRQLLLLHINDNQRPSLLNEVVQLTTECRAMEHQWRTGKETYHRDYVVVAAKAAAAAAAKANAELKAQTEKDIAVLKIQIANLQRQLDAVAARRSQMLFATQGAA
ncbi:hypothetical protein EC957_010734 [Mortierella hygrophila]|uniref:Uncharacterized protein n=1 Tax=Mortierella hygrophila TaxID=979708 RepID=A0A9P6FHZ2_9FUNG|nr:hypothetical protein EC957_010734 [Mortierella hygrophila]